MEQAFGQGSPRQNQQSRAKESQVPRTPEGCVDPFYDLKVRDNAGGSSVTVRDGYGIDPSGLRIEIVQDQLGRGRPGNRRPVQTPLITEERTPDSGKCQRDGSAGEALHGIGGGGDDRCHGGRKQVDQSRPIG